MVDERALPTGIVTFVFTDIEGSTRMLRRLGDRYSDLLDRHLRLLTEAWDRHRGHHLDSAGDGVLVAFQEASDAVLACAMAQRLLGSEPWPSDGEIRVRMGMHTGLAKPQGHDYRALAVHQAARVMSAAHGGQVLVTAATADHVPRLDGVSLVPRGRYRVRDFEEPVALYELAGPDLADTFPAIRAVPADGHNLVPPPTTFHGRREEVERVSGLLGPGRLVTLTGAGGVGKTRLATEIGLRNVDGWPDGVWKIDLAPVEDDAVVAATVAAAVGVPGRGGDRWEEVVDHLRERQALLLFDNCERLVQATGIAVDDLLSRCPACGVLATSREPLAIAREWLWRVGPLDLPSPGATSESAADSPAVQLFLDRVGLVRPDLELRATAAVVEICRKLDGLPLALELAGARLAVLSPDEVLRGLQDRFRLLRGRDPAVPERQRTLEASLQWSNRLLGEAEQACLRRLGVFGTAFTVAAASAAVAAGDVPSFDVPELVWSLVDKSLVSADLTANESRYRLLESVREFARRQLTTHGELSEAAERLTTWYLERLGPAKRDEAAWASEIAVEVDNLRALVPLVAPTRPDLAQELAFTIVHHLDVVHAYRDGIAELRGYVDELTAETPARTSLLTSLADLHLRVGERDAATALLQRAEDLHDRVGLPPWDDVALDRTRCDLANRSGDPSAAVRCAEAALAGRLTPRGQARLFSQVGIAKLALGDLTAAAEAFRSELDRYRTLGVQASEASSLGNLAEVALRQGDRSAAARHQQACLHLALALGAPALVAFSLIVAARLAAVAEDWRTAVALHAKADAMLDDIGLVLYADDRRESDEVLDRARRALGEGPYVEACAEGGALDVVAGAELADRVLADTALV
ncbi:MAG TPA: adenylate/guanylate cyclase domain-containing protein [Acidimicrobiales bacterium]|nr:adenylate/guanylate cyclase domain-containing protein [Acidimicrobiales bacterium]